jgi:uncharacterized protein (TIGR02594 family)
MTAMANGTPWLTRMQALDGTKWAPGDGPNTTIKDWLSFIAKQYPNIAPYCNSAAGEDYFSWCGLTVGYCMAYAQIAPIFGTQDVTRFLYATAWLGWGTPVTIPQSGDVVVFDFGGGDHHVTLFEKDNGDGTWACHGGNQSHAVNVTNFPKSCMMGVRRPNGVAVQMVAANTLAPGAAGRSVTALQSALAARGFDPGGIDGEFGPLTSAAVSTLQRARSLPVTGVADPTTLAALGVSETSPVQNDAQPAARPSVSAVTPPQGSLDIAQILQTVILALTGKPAQSQSGAGSSAGNANGNGPPVLSIIDQIFGGQSLVGMKTMLATVAYVILLILQADGWATGMTGKVLTYLIVGFGGLGVTAKVDRLIQTVAQIAKQNSPTS